MNKALVRGATKRQTFYDQHKTANYVLTVKRKYCRSYYPTDLEGQENSFCSFLSIATAFIISSVAWRSLPRRYSAG